MANQYTKAKKLGLPKPVYLRVHPRLEKVRRREMSKPARKVKVHVILDKKGQRREAIVPHVKIGVDHGKSIEAMMHRQAAKPRDPGFLGWLRDLTRCNARSGLFRCQKQKFLWIFPHGGQHGCTYTEDKDGESSGMRWD